jgi:hypothetical protein
LKVYAVANARLTFDHCARGSRPKGVVDWSLGAIGLIRARGPLDEILLPGGGVDWKVGGARARDKL